MKRVVICLIGAIILSNCEVSVKKTSGQGRNIVCPGTQCIYYEKVTIEDMDFGVFTSTHNYSMAPFVVNLTREKLEIEFLKKQLRP